jgi:uncharacterized protein
VAYLQPERYFSRISRIDIKRDLVEQGYRFALLDIDNTVRSRATDDVPRDVRVWLARARDAGIGFYLVSNNWHANVHELSAELGIPVVGKACKPLPFGFMAARRRLGARRGEVVVIGDQLSTDVIGAHNAGLPAYLVAPLVEQDLKHTVYVRKLERMILGDLQPEGVPVAGAAAPAGAVAGAAAVSGLAGAAASGTAPGATVASEPLTCANDSSVEASAKESASSAEPAFPSATAPARPSAS